MTSTILLRIKGTWESDKQIQINYIFLLSDVTCTIIQFTSEAFDNYESLLSLALLLVRRRLSLSAVKAKVFMVMALNL